MEKVREDKTITIEIYWDDLTEKAQDDIREALHMEPDENGNWDVIPMATLEFEEDDDDE